MHDRNGKRGRQTRMRTRSGLVGLLIVVTAVAGCATGRKSGPQSVQAIPGGEGPTVTRFQDGREGFNISEHVDMTAVLRTAFAQAVALLEAGNYAEAIPILEQVIASSPEVTAPYIDIAMAYRHTGKNEQAEKHLKTALKLVPAHPVASNEYGLLLRRSGRFAEARTVYEKALAQFPEYLPVRRNLGILCDLYLNDQACALEQYRIYSEAKPEDEEVKLWLAGLSLRAHNE
jgi:Tfp pilus assembly protein PilF